MGLEVSVELYLKQGRANACCSGGVNDRHTACLADVSEEGEEGDDTRNGTHTNIAVLCNKDTYLTDQ
jgi:hypothetical protein